MEPLIVTTADLEGKRQVSNPTIFILNDVLKINYPAERYLKTALLCVGKSSDKKKFIV